MAIASMTGFARAAGAAGPYAWAWEIKSVNARGLDLRLRLPPGFDALEPEARRRAGARLARGTVYATLAMRREAAAPDVRVNMELLSRLLGALNGVERPQGVAPASLDGLLALRGVVETAEAPELESALEEARAAALEGFEAALDALCAMRAGEGAAIGAALAQRLARVGDLTARADASPGRQPAAVMARLGQSVAALGGTGLDPARLHQEALLLAGKADVREELDRLEAHRAAAQALLAAGGPVGRRLDFLAQELAREANTLCAKSNDVELTAIGMELRVEIEQFREQVQNVE
ncbi:YicC/YloC family endoribonuclease [Methylocella sp.]|uniref:YicC/YloC family endoribonuclease n=1 Tax=Methylocella sp. TaxID=1978226 RepID=UPI0037839043